MCHMNGLNPEGSSKYLEQLHLVGVLHEMSLCWSCSALATRTAAGLRRRRSLTAWWRATSKRPARTGALASRPVGHRRLLDLCGSHSMFPSMGFHSLILVCRQMHFIFVFSFSSFRIIFVPFPLYEHSARLTATKKGSPYSITKHRIQELIPVLGLLVMCHKPGGRLPLLSARPAVTPATLKMAATNFAAWWTEAPWVWTVCLRLLPNSVATVIWTQALLCLSPAR